MIGAQGTEALGAAGMTNLVINLSVSLLMGLMLLPTTSVAAAHAKNDPAKVRSCSRTAQVPGLRPSVPCSAGPPAESSLIAK